MARSDALFVTDGELASRLGLTLDQLKIALPGAEKAGFPVKDPLFADRRYWPACVAWLDRRYGIRENMAPVSFVPDEEEPWRTKPTAAAKPSG